MAPKDENELQHMLKTAVGCGCPVSLRYPRGKGAGASLDGELKTMEIGKGEVLQEGSDLALIAIGIGGKSGSCGGKAAFRRRI